ncbi:hypothetical protein [Martelella soudanensis]|uniref:hypothetical protein n=1 Tax=unclassified Martelella TaxID=2629616 RepID=UPI0015DDDD02|nr:MULTISPECIES: hypothetical protein [unclassified Martelella]
MVVAFRHDPARRPLRRIDRAARAAIAAIATIKKTQIGIAAFAAIAADTAHFPADIRGRVHITDKRFGLGRAILTIATRTWRDKGSTIATVPAVPAEFNLFDAIRPVDINRRLQSSFRAGAEKVLFKTGRLLLDRKTCR